MAQGSLFIINPAAGGGRSRARWEALQRDAGLRDRPLVSAITVGPGHALALARESAHRYERVIAVGGDGTISEVAAGLLAAADSQAALGIIPLGTGNDIAHMCGILNPRGALQALNTGATRRMDVLEVRRCVQGAPATRHALLFAGVGVASTVLRYTPRLSKRVLGRAWAYRAGLLWALWRYQATCLRINCDGNIWEMDCLFLGASNGENAGGGMRLAPNARSDDGLLNVNLVGAVGRWEALKQLRRLNSGKHTTHPAVRYFTAKDISIESQPETEVAADGEVIGCTPARFLVKPSALTILAPSQPEAVALSNG